MGSHHVVFIMITTRFSTFSARLHAIRVERVLSGSRAICDMGGCKHVVKLFTLNAQILLLTLMILF